jgi:hypothetical protein
MAVSNVIIVNNEFPGGASRIKSHLAGVKGHDIAICKAVPRRCSKRSLSSNWRA